MGLLMGMAASLVLNQSVPLTGGHTPSLFKVLQWRLI